jgi:hypothetical protein
MAQPRGRPRLAAWAHKAVSHVYCGTPTNLVTNRRATVGGTVVPRSVMGGRAMVMAGSSGYVSDSLGSSISGFDPWTYALLVWFDSISGGVAQSIVTMAQSPGAASNDRALCLTSGGKFGAYVFDGSFSVANGATTVATGTLYRVVVTCSSSSLRVYVNGQLDGSDTVTTPGSGYGSGVSLVLGYGGGAPAQGGSATLTTGVNIPLFLRVPNEAWSAEKAMIWSADPYSVFSPPNKRQIFGVTAAGGGFKAAWARGANTVISTGVRAA